MNNVSIHALIANAACLNILQKLKSNEVCLKVSMIFIFNDVIINGGVVLADF